MLSAAVINWAAAEKGVSRANDRRANDRQSRGFVAGQREIELREHEKRDRERERERREG